MATELSCVVINLERDHMLSRFLESFMYQETEADLVIVDMASSPYSDQEVGLINKVRCSVLAFG